MVGGIDWLGVAFERVAQRPQVHVPVDATELLAGLDHPRGAPAQRHLPVAPVLDVARVRAADRDHALHRVRRRYERPRRRRSRRPHRRWWSGVWAVYGATVRDRGAGSEAGWAGRSCSVGWEPVLDA